MEVGNIPELAFKILVEVPYPFISEVSKTNKLWKEVCEEPYFWECKIVKDFGSEVRALKPDSIRFKDFYKMHYQRTKLLEMHLIEIADHKLGLEELAKIELRSKNTNTDAPLQQINTLEADFYNGSCEIEIIRNGQGVEIIIMENPTAQKLLTLFGNKFGYDNLQQISLLIVSNWDLIERVHRY